MKKKVLSSVAAAGVATALLAVPAGAAHEGAVYVGDLSELNNSGASGAARLTVSQDGETMEIAISGSGFNLDGPHAQHIHAIVEGEDVAASTCPTMADDANGDGVLTVVEGAGKYGGVQVSLTTRGDTSADSGLAVERFQAGTSVDYRRAGIPIPDVLKPNLGKVHIVVHGVDENGNGQLDLNQAERSSLTDDLPREGTLPALCGTLAVQATGVIQTGAGGTAPTPDSNNAPALAGAALVGLAAGGVALRRRTNS